MLAQATRIVKTSRFVGVPFSSPPRHKPPGSHHSCGVFRIADAVKPRNDDSAPKSANQCNVAERAGEDHQSVDLAADIYGP